MTDYCTVADASTLLPGGPTFTTTTKPTAAACATILASVTAEIDMHLRGQGYTTPAVDPQALASLKTICMNGTAARIGKAMTSGKDDDKIANLREDYQAGLAFIDEGKLGPDSTSTSGASIGNGMVAWTPPHTLADYGVD